MAWETDGQEKRKEEEVHATDLFECSDPTNFIELARRLAQDALRAMMGARQQTL